LRKISLIIPCITDRNDIPSSTSKKKKATRHLVPKWLDTYFHWRYLGYLDLDPNLKHMMANKTPLFSDQPDSYFAYTTEYKLAFVNRMLKEKLTYGQMAELCPEFKKLLLIMDRLLPALPESCEAILYYSGGCGFRVLFWAPQAWQRVIWQDQTYARVAEKGLMPFLLRHVLHLPPDICADLQPYIDGNVYDIDKGVKPDVLAHFETNVFPVAFHPGFRAERPRRDRGDPVLERAITTYWHRLFYERIPPDLEKLPRLTGPPMAKKKGNNTPAPVVITMPALVEEDDDEEEEEAVDAMDLDEPAPLSLSDHLRLARQKRRRPFPDAPAVTFLPFGFPVMWIGGWPLMQAFLARHTLDQPVILGFTNEKGVYVGYGELEKRNAGAKRGSDMALLLSRRDFSHVIGPGIEEEELEDGMMIDEPASSSSLDWLSLLHPDLTQAHASFPVSILEEGISDYLAILPTARRTVIPASWNQRRLFTQPGLRHAVLHWFIRRLVDASSHQWTKEQVFYWVGLEYALVGLIPTQTTSLTPVETSTLVYLKALLPLFPDQRRLPLQQARFPEGELILLLRWRWRETRQVSVLSRDRRGKKYCAGMRIEKPLCRFSVKKKEKKRSSPWPRMRTRLLNATHGLGKWPQRRARPPSSVI
jgi:hypothetical protein